ncbi:MAG TPA: hypothetical protein DCZ92_15530 [Elusimicrobia bacterium]|nr:MAG: hypothetical protein A2016_12070 [Elusimicrobia bacterium GWF2_62_30]HBA62191.1 hypothetical protein [Elusimicrobiota bacterium]
MAIKEIKNKAEFERMLQVGGDTFLLFYSPWCPFCLEFAPAFEKLEASSPGYYCKASVEELPELEDLFSIEVVPTVLFFRGGILNKRLDGVLDAGLAPENLAEFVWRCRGIANK